ncbi:hypothetical protein ACFVFS_19465 [Kitasatospora sp. NPDC057692]|uniref:hypothetical protein n=1 Tax=Kitasatospora sp. NPDC057692 TaxID=3346215 RepID=UPI003698445C
MPPPPDHLTAEPTARDPLRRDRAGAGRLVDHPVDESVDESAAERRLAFDGRTLADRIEHGTARHAPEQPALHFRDGHEARDALRDWFLQQQAITDRLEPLVLGALAAGLDPAEVCRISGVPLSGIERLQPEHIEVSTDLGGAEALEVLDEMARALTAHALVLADAARTGDRTGDRIGDRTGDRENDEECARSPESCAARLWSAAARSFVRTPVTVLGPDAWLAAEVSRFHREAAALRRTDRRVTDDGDAARRDAMARAYEELATAYLHLRATGAVPPLPLPEAPPR